MKFRFNYYTIFFTVIILSMILFPQYTYTQALFELPGSRIIKSPHGNIVTPNKENKIRLLKSAGIKIGFTINEYGWHHPFPVITNNYHDAGISTASIGAYFEGLSTRFFSTVAEIAYRSRKLDFDYNLYDGNGNIIGTNNAGNSFNLTTFCITEKIKYTRYIRYLELAVYGFGGFKYDIINSAKFDSRFEPYLKNYKQNSAGFITGIGISIGKKFRFSTDIYYSGDFTNIIETENGNFKNAEIGILVGFGYMNF